MDVGRRRGKPRSRDTGWRALKGGRTSDESAARSSIGHEEPPDVSSGSAMTPETLIECLARVLAREARRVASH